MKNVSVTMATDDVYPMLTKKHRTLNISLHFKSRIMALLSPFSVFPIILLNFLLYATLTEQKIVRNLSGGISYANFVSHDKRRLDTEQLASITAQSSTDCGGKCLLNENCFSMNYGGVGGHECQLLAANQFESSTKMTSDENFQHLSVASPCDNGPCLNGEKCLPIYEQNNYICDAGRTLSSPNGTWTAFWWYDVNTTWPSHENDVLAYDFGHCQASDPYCFGRLPLDAIEDSTEMLAVDSQGNEYKWSFQPNNSVAHAAWRAFHGHEVIPKGEVIHARPAWNPEVLNGTTPERDQDAFMYRKEEGVKSVLLDDDGCDCYSSLSFGHAMCGSSHSKSYGPTGQYGVDALYDPYCNVPRPGIGLTLYFRHKR